MKKKKKSESQTQKLPEVENINLIDEITPRMGNFKRLHSELSNNNLEFNGFLIENDSTNFLQRQNFNNGASSAVSNYESKSPIHATSSNLNTNEDPTEEIIKEYLSNHEVPKEVKDKVNVLKKFTTHYKKVREDKLKLTKLLNRLSEFLSESAEDIRVKFL